MEAKEREEQRTGGVLERPLAGEREGFQLQSVVLLGPALQVGLKTSSMHRYDDPDVGGPAIQINWE